MTDAPKTPAWHQSTARPEDVQFAFRMILGRQGSATEVESLVTRGVSVGELRQIFLNSPEFSKSRPPPKGPPTATSRRALELRPLDDPRIIYLHVPKCGGTTMHALLTAWFGAKNAHPERYNGLYDYHVADLAGHKIFSGHYDFYSTCLVPGRSFRLSFLRDPMARLISLYHFHRAHSAAFIERHNLTLARWANEYDIDAYFANERVRANVSIDNTMARNFSNVPQVVHTQPGVAGAPPPVPMTEMCRQAKANMAAFDLIGFMDVYDASVDLLAEMLGQPPVSEFRSEQVLDDLMDRDPNMRRIDRQTPSAETLAHMEELIRYDREVYAEAERLFRPRIDARAEAGSAEKP